MSDHALFVVAPYLSVATLVVASVVRVFYPPRPVQPQSPHITTRPVLRRHPALTIGGFGVLAGHVVIVAYPDRLLRWTHELNRLIVFELAFFVLGLVTLAGVSAAIRRHVLQPVRHTSSLTDVAFLGVLFLVVISGLGLAVAHRWASAWSAITLTIYLRSLLSLEPNLQPVTAMPYLVKLHIFSSIVAVALLPFTHVIGVFMSFLRRAADLAIHPVADVLAELRPVLERVRPSRRNLISRQKDD